jgi:hypothetical protein
LLSQGVVDFINSTRGVGIKEGKVNVSKIYNCFQTEFGETGQDWNINAAQKVSN